MSRPSKRAPPEGLRAAQLEVGGERLLVLSYPLKARDVRDGFRLTSAEAEVAKLAIAGLSNAEIANRRGASVRTVANQMAAVLRKVGVASRHELAVRFAHAALERDDEPR